MKQYLLKTFFVALFLITATGASAHNFEVDGIYYEILSSTSKTAKVTYKGYNYQAFSDEYSGDVIIPERVTCEGETYDVISIGAYAFIDCPSLTSVRFPKSVTNIERCAFYSCTGLTSVTIPNGITNIGLNAFAFCTSLKSISLPKSLTDIGDNIFYDCSSLTDITFSGNMTDELVETCYGTPWYEAWYESQPAGIIYLGNVLYKYKGTMPDGTTIKVKEGTTRIAGGAFSGCRGLENIEIPESVTSIGSSAFYDTDWYNNQPDGLVYAGKVLYNYKGTMAADTSIIVKDGTLGIATSAFMSTNLANIEIPNSVTNIGKNAFRNCYGLTSVTLPNGLKKISQDLFYNCYNLKKITIPESVCEIEEFAFCNTGIRVINIPKNVTYIHYAAFQSSKYLKSIIIPESLKNITEVAFYECATDINVYNYSSLDFCNSFIFGRSTDIFKCKIDIIDDFIFTAEAPYTLIEYIGADEEISLPDNYKGEKYNIEAKAFAYCYDLKSIRIAGGVQKIGGSAFLGNNLETVYIDDIGAWCNIDFAGTQSTPLNNKSTKVYFNGDSATDIVIPEGVKEIKQYAFYNCEDITSVTIPNSVTSIGDNAFQYCTGLKSVTIPNSVTSIGYNAFNSCNGLTAVHISDLAAWCNIDFNHNHSNPLYYAHNLYLNGEKVTNIEIPNGVTSISDNAFYDCDGLTSITIPNSVTSIGDNAFYDCDGLTSVTIPNSVTRIGVEAFSYTPWYSSQPNGIIYIGNILYKYKGTMPKGTTIKVKEGTTKIAGGAFSRCEGLESIEIPNSVTTIGEEAFYGCTGLTSITIPNSVTTIGNYAFSNCTGLTSITIPNSVTTIGSYVFKYCSGLTNVTIPNRVTSIGNYTFQYCSGLTDVTIPNSVTSIGYYAFQYCKGLTSVTIPNSVTSIGGSAFEDCYNLKNIYINSLIDWCNIDFGNAYSNPLNYAGNLYLNGEKVTDIVIPEGVEEIKQYAFYRCKAFTNMPTGVTKIGKHAFDYTSWYESQPDGVIYIDDVLYTYKGTMPSETTIKVKEGTTEIFTEAFASRSQLASIELPESVTSIGDGAFFDCSRLTSITIPSNVTSIGKNAFQYCSNIKNIYAMGKTPANAYGCGINKSAYLYVPAGSKAAYKAADYWKEFINIIEIKDDQAIVWNELAAKIYGDEDFALPATTDKGLTITYTSDNEDVATINGNIVTIKNAGVANITATQNGNDYYNAATPVTHQLVVSKITQTITYDELPVMTFGDAPIELIAVAGSSNEVVFESSDETVATISEKTLTIVGAGKCIITAYCDGDNNYYDASPKSIELTVKKAPLTITAEDIVCAVGESFEYKINYDGFKGDDDISVLDAVPSIECEAGEEPSVGTYEIILSGGYDNNYEYILVNGTLTINDTSGINDIKIDLKENNVYNLKGQRVIDTENITRGFYIINGKKVFIK